MELQGPLVEAQLEDDFIVRFEAINPATGAAVSGVTVAHASLLVEDTGENLVLEDSGPLVLTPAPPA